MRPSLFVTGAAGYVGRCLLEQVPRDGGSRVVALVRDPGQLPAARRRRPDIEWVAGDLCSPKAWESRLAAGSYVLHLAAQTGKTRRSEYFRVNAEGTRALVDAAARAGVRGLIHVSSIAASFADQERYWYAHSKVISEQIVARSGVAFTIVRPTMILGPAAPLLQSLQKLARGPVMPIFGDGRVKVQPIRVDDVAACLLDLVAQHRVAGETLELGGPDVLTIEELIRRIRDGGADGSARALHLPLRPLRRVIGWLEPLLLPVLPLTAGQLAAFANDGTAIAHPWVDARRASMAHVDAMLRDRIDPDAGLATEGRILSRYLAGITANEYVLSKYVAYHRAYPEELTALDRWLLAWVRRAPLGARLADVYTSRFHTASPVRRKLILMLALLECAPPSFSRFEGPDGGRARVWASLTLHAGSEAVCLAVAALLFLPVHLLTRLGAKPGATGTGSVREPGS